VRMLGSRINVAVAGRQTPFLCSTVYYVFHDSFLSRPLSRSLKSMTLNCSLHPYLGCGSKSNRKPRDGVGHRS
jgi:hypothetical protein